MTGDLPRLGPHPDGKMEKRELSYSLALFELAASGTAHDSLPDATTQFHRLKRVKTRKLKELISSQTKETP